MKRILITIVLDVVLSFYCLSNPVVTSIPFQLNKKFIIVHASADGKKGNFLLDTGVSEMILNNKHFNGKLTDSHFYGIHGNEIEKETKFVRFYLEGFEKKTIAILTDFNALESMTGVELLGVIGNNIFKNCELVIDYTFKELTIYQLDKNGIPLSSKEIHQNSLDTLSFLWVLGIPLVEVYANGKLLKMLVDSGATANVIDENEVEGLNTDLNLLREVSLISFGPEKVSVKYQLIDKLRVGKLICPPMKTLFVSLDHLNEIQTRSNVHGILGYEFMSNFRVAINFKKREVYLWDRESVELQWILANK